MHPNQVYTHQFTFSQAEVDQFAQLTGDNNPIHLDAEYAAQTAFRKPIIHGFLAGSIFSKILGTQFPGEGTLYLKQNIEFLAPMFVDTTYEAVFTVKEIGEKSTALIQTQIVEKNTQKLTVNGEAIVMNRQKIERQKTK